MPSEAGLDPGPHGLVPTGPGWFVLNAREARWFGKPGQGHSLPLTGHDAYEAETFFPLLGMSIRVFGPSQPSTMYHWEADQEDFLVLSGEALLIIEGEERPLHAWDLVHCPPNTSHTIVGAGDGPCVVVAVGVRDRSVDSPDWGGYPVDDVALRHGAGVEEETNEPEKAYAGFTRRTPTRYTDWLD